MYMNFLMNYDLQQIYDDIVIFFYPERHLQSKNVVIVIRISDGRQGLSSLRVITSSATTPAPFKLQTKIVNITPEILSEIFLLCLFLSFKNTS